MAELIIWSAVVLLIIVAFGALARDHQRYHARGAEEYEEAVRAGRITGRALVRAGFIELDKLQHPSAEAAAAHIEDEKQGQTSISFQ